MKALTLKGAVVKCDESNCDWTKKTDTFEDILIWHNVPCPKCNKGVILNNEEFDMMNMLKAVSKVDVLSNEKTTTVSIDSFNLR